MSSFTELLKEYAVEEAMRNAGALAAVPHWHPATKQFYADVADQLEQINKHNNGTGTIPVPVKKEGCTMRMKVSEFNRALQEMNKVLTGDDEIDLSYIPTSVGAGIRLSAINRKIDIDFSSSNGKIIEVVRYKRTLIELTK